MRLSDHLGRILWPLAVSAAAWTGCSTVLCDGDSYGGGLGSCSLSDYQFSVSPTAVRTDLRDLSPLRIEVTAQRISNHRSFQLRDLPQVWLSQNGDAAAQVTASLDEASHDVLISRSPEQLRLGQLTASLMLPNVAIPLSTDGRHRVLRSPRFGSAMALMGASNPNRGATVTGRPALQVASPVATPGTLLVTELISTITGPASWIDLYEQTSPGMIGYANAPTWNLTQRMLQESPAALFGLISGGVLIYDDDSAAGRKDLWMLPLLQSRTARLSLYEPRIPANATALAACGEELAFVMGSAGDVSVFLANPSSMTAPVKSIGRYAVSGVPLLAARGVTGSVPKLASKEFFAASVDAAGQVMRVRLTPADSSQPTGIQTVATADAALQSVGELSALALADLDSDGLQDLVMARKQDGSLVYFPQHPDGSFPQAVELDISQPGTASISIGDLSGDGAPDLALATSDKQAFVYFNQL